MMQLKLELEEDFSKSGRKYITKDRVQTGKLKGTFKTGEPHPWIKNLFYNKWYQGRERWASEKINIRDLNTKAAWASKYRKTERGRALRKKQKADRRARHKNASIGLTLEEESEVQQIYAHAVRVSNKLQIPFHVDHIVPLTKGGLHHPMNLQVVPAKWNIIKGNRNTERWLPNGM
jgi:hypothetical protein